MLNNQVAGETLDDENRPVIYVMVGIPGCGKSTYIDKVLRTARDCVVVSSDNILDAKAKATGKTYNEVWKTDVKAAQKQVQQDFTNAIKNSQSVIWDQTNLSVNKRKEILGKVPKNYYKVAVFIHTPYEVCKERVAARAKATGKDIPDNVLQGMNAKLQVPSVAEGFDEVVLV